MGNVEHSLQHYQYRFFERSASASAAGPYLAVPQTNKAANKHPQAGTSTAKPLIIFTRHQFLTRSTLPSPPSLFLIVSSKPIAFEPYSICPTLNISPNIYSGKDDPLLCSRPATGKLAIALAHVGPYRENIRIMPQCTR